MSTSPKPKAEFEFASVGAPESPLPVPAANSINSAGVGGTQGSEAFSSANVAFQRFSTDSSIYAMTAREAGRINAASVSEEERDSLLKEREQLLEKKFQLGLTRKEANRLTYVRWSLDRVEDALHGRALDLLDASVSTYEGFKSDLDKLVAQLHSLKR